MSQQVQIDYKHIACQCNTVCNMAEQRLKEIPLLALLWSCSIPTTKKMTVGILKNILDKLVHLSKQHIMADVLFRDSQCLYPAACA